jgi:UDP-glucose 4-epimerase
MKVLITGGAGFVGSHVVEELLRRGHQVTSLDDMSNGNEDFINAVSDHPNHTFIHDTVLNDELVDELVENHDCVFHLAAVLGVKNCVENPRKVIDGNIIGTRNIAASCMKWNKKLVFSSTSEVYGKNPNIPFSEDADRVLGATTVHRWSYATAKAIDEHLCLAYGKEGLRVTVLRYFNIYGPRSVATPYAGVIPRFIDAALSHETLRVFGNGLQTRCFTYVSDCVEATIAALSAAADGEVINIGTTEETAIKQLAETVLRLSNSTSSIEYVPYEEAYGPGYEDTPKRVPVTTKLQTILHHTPRVSLIDGLKETIAWHEQRQRNA